MNTSMMSENDHHSYMISKEIQERYLRKALAMYFFMWGLLLGLAIAGNWVFTANFVIAAIVVFFVVGFISEKIEDKGINKSIEYLNENMPDRLNFK